MTYWEADSFVFRGFDFLVWASDGLWDVMTTGRACEIVASTPVKNKAPKALVDVALKQAVFCAPRKGKQQHLDTTEFLATLNPVSRRLVHDDISVCVMYFEEEEFEARQMDERIDNEHEFIGADFNKNSPDLEPATEQTKQT